MARARAKAKGGKGPKRCYECDLEGHFASACPSKGKGKAKGQGKSKGYNNYNSFGADATSREDMAAGAREVSTHFLRVMNRPTPTSRRATCASSFSAVGPMPGPSPLRFLETSQWHTSRFSRRGKGPSQQ